MEWVENFDTDKFSIYGGEPGITIKLMKMIYLLSNIEGAEIKVEAALTKLFKEASTLSNDHG